MVRNARPRQALPERTATDAPAAPRHPRPARGGPGGSASEPNYNSGDFEWGYRTRADATSHGRPDVEDSAARKPCTGDYARGSGGAWGPHGPDRTWHGYSAQSGGLPWESPGSWERTDGWGWVPPEASRPHSWDGSRWTRDAGRHGPRYWDADWPAPRLGCIEASEAQS